MGLNKFYTASVFDDEGIYQSRETKPLETDRPHRSFKVHAAAITAKVVLVCVTAFSYGVGTVDEYPDQITEEVAAEAFEDFRSLQAGWDGYNALAPNDIAVALARSVTDIAATEGLTVNHASPAGEDGIGLYFLRGDKYADIECLNDGTMFSSLMDWRGNNESNRVFQIDSDGLRDAVRKIRAFLNA